jgi:hypothetical protein
MSATAEKTDGATLNDLRAECLSAGIEDFLAGPGRDLFGLKPVQARIRDVASLRLIARVRQGLGFTADRPALPMSFTGNPGTGKTTVALRMAGILKALGFVRQACDLYRRDNEHDYEQEAIEIRLQLMEGQRENLMMILAGYGDRMDKLFTMNPWFRSRRAGHIDCPGYDDGELFSTGETMLRRQNYIFSPSRVFKGVPDCAGRAHG